MEVTAMIKAVLLLVMICMAGAQQRQFINHHQVFFPDSHLASVANNRQSGPKLKPRCANGLEENEPCINDEDYNASIQNRFRFLLRRFRGSEIVTNDVYQALATPEKIDILPPLPSPPSPQTRMFTTESPVCAAEETIIYPKRARTQSDEWVFVLNQGNTQQGVRVEKCISNNRPCTLGAAGTEIDTVCRQKYIYKKLLVMTSAGTDIVPESVLMPSCCVCYRKKVVDDDFFIDLRTSHNKTEEDLEDFQDSAVSVLPDSQISLMDKTTLAPTTTKETQSIEFQME